MIYTRTALLLLAEAEALKQEIDPSVVCAVCDCCSQWMPATVTPSTDSLNPSLTYRDQAEQMLNRSYLGLMQFLGASARDLGYKQDLEGLLVPETNLEIGVKLLKRSLAQTSDRLDRALVLMYGQRSSSLTVRVFSKINAYHRHLTSPARPQIAEQI